MKETEGLTASSISKRNFYLFGLALEIEERTLHEIYDSTSSVTDKMVDVFRAWKRESVDPGVYSWQRLVYALLEIKQNSIAGKIAHTHGEYTCTVCVLYSELFLLMKYIMLIIARLGLRIELSSHQSHDQPDEFEDAHCDTVSGVHF